MKNYPKFKAAAVQAAPVFLDAEGTADKVVKRTKEAAANGKHIPFSSLDLSGTRHSFLDCFWDGAIGKGDWRPDKYIEWFREAQETNYWGSQEGEQIQ